MSCSHKKKVAASKGTGTVNALLVALLLCGTVISCVVLGIVGAYCAVAGLLAAVNPSRPENALAKLVPHQSHVSGD
jgi:hypothetical protein